ncbi:AAA family ATPase [Comamonas endophytica]|uniref:ATP-binding protein n=1 Tax=Comamonas endophytica TaxID=2949090 RepID=A0ABY6G9A6_9BURK|nr:MULTISPECIES: AAA family ATPase [unclassified Acidovorax]MCD2511890.1 ATP-binding protein [Acidovorax sp. D4N7]UYG51609.1 ATP-binding protein [Acidovorax sp. 5MLIR]
MRIGYFRREALARQMAQQLLRPGILDQGLRSGLFLSGSRRTGKTTFLQQDLMPALEAHDAVVVYVDLWSDTQADPGALVHAAIRSALQDLQTPASGVLARLARIKGLDVEALGLKFGFELADLGTRDGPTLAQALMEVVDKAQTHVVLIVDKVQQVLATEQGAQLMLALKAARDAINPRPHTPGYFLFIGTGSHRAQVSSLTLQGKQAFAGATSLGYPTLGDDYVEYLLGAVGAEGAKVPSLSVAVAAFKALDHRPEEMLRALRMVQQYDEAQVDAFFPVIALTLKTAAADVELRKIEDLGLLAMAVFGRVAAEEEGVRGLFSAESIAAYGALVGHEVSTDQVQRVADDLRNANLIMRKSHGMYCVTDPFVRGAWLSHKAAGAALRPAG